VADATRPIFSIGAVARMLELPPATIRTWETRYGLVVPQRSPGGQRLYTRAQVEHLRFLRGEVEQGSRPAEAHRLLAERLASRTATAPATAGPRVRVELADGGSIAADLLRQLLQRGGFVVTDGEAQLAVVGVRDARGAALCRRLKQRGDRVLALVEGDGQPAADAVLRLPVSPSELIAAARSLAG
jgi:DNA-binding transcriptional MerR regulator